MKQLTSLEAFHTAAASGTSMANVLFDGEPVISKDFAKRHNLPVYTSNSRCKKCNGNKRININSEQWSENGNHNGECYPCFNANSRARSGELRAFLKRCPEDKIKLKQLQQLKIEIEELLECQCHIHHIIPCSMKNQYLHPELNEHSSNKIVVTVTEHKHVHDLIREGNTPMQAIDILGIDIFTRMVC